MKIRYPRKWFSREQDIIGNKMSEGFLGKEQSFYYTDDDLGVYPREVIQKTVKRMFEKVFYMTLGDPNCVRTITGIRKSAESIVLQRFLIREERDELYF